MRVIKYNIFTKKLKVFLINILYLNQILRQKSLNSCQNKNFNI